MESDKHLLLTASDGTEGRTRRQHPQRRPIHWLLKLVFGLCLELSLQQLGIWGCHSTWDRAGWGSQGPESTLQVAACGMCPIGRSQQSYLLLPTLLPVLASSELSLLGCSAHSDSYFCLFLVAHGP